MSETIKRLRQEWAYLISNNLVHNEPVEELVQKLFFALADQRKTERRAPITIAEMRSALEVERDMPFSAPEIQLEEFKKRLRM